MDRYLSRKFDRIFNWAIPEATLTGRLSWHVPFLTRSNARVPEAVGTQDFFGLNFYSRDRLRFRLMRSPFIFRETSPGAEVSELGWEIYPEGMDRLLREIRERFPGMEIFITENGIADRDDNQRARYIEEHLRVLSRHRDEGAPIRGYCHWTLNDNFEWAEGYTAHFGFYSLEPGTLKRVPRESASWFGRKVREWRGLGLE
jgi:beta-glucosidase